MNGQAQRAQRKIREARKLLVAARDQAPELRDEITEAIDAAQRAENRSAEILRGAVLGGPGAA